MDLVNFRRGGRVDSLRPTHALQVARCLGDALEVDGTGFKVDARHLARAVDEVRGRYRCRTVRKELRRLGLLGLETPEGASIAVDGADEATMTAIRNGMTA